MPSARPNARQTLNGVFFIHGLLFASWAAHIPHVKTHLGLSNGSLGLVLLATPVGSISAMAIGAWLLPRVGSKRMVPSCVIGYALAGPFVGLAGSPALLFAALLVWGGFQGTLDVSMNTQGVTQERAARRTLMSGLHGRWSLGALAGAGAGALGVWLGLSLTVQLIILGIPVLAGVPLTTSLLAVDSASTAPHNHETGRRRWTGMVVLLGAIAFASMLGEGAAADWSAVYLRDSLGATALVASLGYAVFVLAMVVVRLRADRLFARYQVARVLTVLSGAAAVVFAAGLLSSNAVAALIGLAALGGGLAAVVPSVFSAAGQLPGLPAGAGIAVISAMGWAGFVFGPPIIGQLASLTSLPVALGVVPLLAAFIALAVHRALPHRVSQAHAESLTAHS